jgi:IclR family acetate operon transcriptional repressor
VDFLAEFLTHSFHFINKNPFVLQILTHTRDRPQTVDKGNKIRAEPKYLVKSLDRALAILELMIAEGRDLPLKEIAQRLNLGKGTVHRMLDTLKSRRFVQQDPQTRKYGFGVRSLELGAGAKKEEIIRKAMLPTLTELHRKTKESVNAGILELREIKYIIRLESEELLRVSIQEGSRFPAHSTAAGKVLLSFFKDEELKRLYQDQSAFTVLTEKSVCSVSGLLEEMQKIREMHLAYDDEEAIMGVRCVAAPIRVSQGGLRVAISISSPKERMTRERRLEFSAMLTHAAERISEIFDMGKTVVS